MLCLALLSVGLLLAAVSLCTGAWHRTRLREAYLPELREMARQNPYNGPLLVVLAGRLAQARQYAAAGAAFERAVGAGETRPAVWLAWAASAAASGERQNAWAILRLGQRDPQADPELRAAIDRCKPLPANAAPAALAGALYPAGPESLLHDYTRGSFLNGLSAWYGRRHPEQSGVATREAWAKEQPDSAQAQQLWSEALLRNERYAEADAAFRHTLALAPDSLDAQLGLADSLYHQGEAGQAGLLYIRCYRKDPGSLRALLGLGQVTLDKRLLSMSVDVYQKALKLAPRSADAWIGLGKAYYNQSLDIGRSLDAYATAMKLAPERTDFYQQYADALRVNSRYEEAETLLRKRLAVAPEESSTHYYLAMTLLSHNLTPQRQAEAEAALRTALRLEPRGYTAASRLGRLLVQEGRYAEGLPYLEQALQADPNDLGTTIAMARAYRGMGRTGQARAATARVVALTAYHRHIKEMEDALQQQPLDPSLYQQMARLYVKGGEPEKARNYFDAAVMLRQYPGRAKQGLSAMERATYNTIPIRGESKPSPETR
jgi:tetratricopeptide (TPR) repeat protein